MRNQPIESLTYRGYKINIVPDEDPMNPREWDNLGIMICWHRRYTLGDSERNTMKLTPEEFTEWAEYPEHEVVAKLPLYLYDHSGLTMSVGAFGCSWDSGQVGWIYTTKSRIKDIWGDSAPSNEQIIEALTAEVKEYDKFLTGAYMEYVIVNNRGDAVKSHGGFDNKDYAITEAKAEVDGYVKMDDQLNSKDG